MNINPSEFSVPELANIFDQSARASNRGWQSKQRELSGIDDFELPPAQSFLGRSPIVNFAKQALPENVGSTQLGSWVADQAQQLAEAQPQLRPQINRVNALAQKVPLGGWNPTEHRQYHRERKADTDFRRNSVEVGMVPTADNRSEVKVKGDIGARTAQAAGVVAGDVASDGLRNIWWFINAPQALANLVADETIQREGYKILTPEGGKKRNEPILKNRATRMAATLPAVLATSFGVGNVMREEGYKAVLPSEADPRQSENAIAEAGSRYFLGRTGGMLPYDEFVKERPDVSKEEYYKYKTYLHNKNLDINPLDGDFNVGGVIKGTVDGIHGPEVSFLGKSIPALTGLVPIATAVAGSRRGMKRAGRILNEKGEGGQSMREKARESADTYRAYQAQDRSYKVKKELFDNGESMEEPTQYVSPEMLDNAANVKNDTQRAVERVTLENALAGGGIGAVGGGVGATALESVIRSLKPTVSYEEEV